MPQVAVCKLLLKNWKETYSANTAAATSFES